MQRQSRFSNRVLAVIILMIVALTASFLTFQIFYIRKVLDKQVASWGMSLAQSISQSSELGVISNEPVFLDQPFTIAMDNQKTVFVVAYDAEGKIIHQVSRTSMNLDLPRSIAKDIQGYKSSFVGDLVRRSGGNTDDFYAPVLSAASDEYLFEEPGQKVPQRTVGLIRLGISRSFTQSVMQQSVIVFVAIALVAVTVGLIVAIVLSRHITRPLKELEIGTKHIAAGDMGVELTVETNDEVGSLATSFNTMVKVLRETTISRDYYDGILRSMNDMLVVTDEDGRIKSVNEKVVNVMGYKVEELLGRQISGFFDKRYANFEENVWQPLLKEGTVADRESLAVKNSGSRFYVAISAAKLEDVRGGKHEIVLNARDITERKQVEEMMKEANRELLRLNRVKSEFVSMISHELRTPLSSIKAGIDIVLKGIDGPVSAGQQESLGIAKQNVDRLARLISNVLDFTKLESGKMEAIFESANINELVRDVCNLMRPQYEKKEIKFLAEIPEESIVAVCDDDKIKQVLINLVDNAIKFTEAGGRVTVRLSRVSEGIRLDVEDTGIGIKDEEKSRIFEVFGQIAHRGIWKTGGAGLGLTICNQIVEQHKGKISLKSVYGEGSIFTVIFPSDLPITS